MTTLLQQFEKQELVARLWTTLLPDLPTPSPERLLRWAVTYDEEVILHGVRRLSKKLHKLKQESAVIDAERLTFYADSVMASEQQMRQRREVRA